MARRWHQHRIPTVHRTSVNRRNASNIFQLWWSQNQWTVWKDSILSNEWRPWLQQWFRFKCGKYLFNFNNNLKTNYSNPLIRPNEITKRSWRRPRTSSCQTARLTEIGRCKTIKQCWIHKQVKKGSPQLLEAAKTLVWEILTALMLKDPLYSPKLQESNLPLPITTNVARHETEI